MRATLAVVLLLAGTPAARAEESAPAADARDTDHDGEVSGRERRRARRADRRARRGEKGANGEILADEEQDSADAAASAERGKNASRAAAGAAAALKSALPSAEAGALPPGAAGKAAASPGGSGGAPPPAGKGGLAPSAFSAGASGDPGRPKAPSDFVLAARSGYSPAFAAAGLKLSADGRSIVRADGSAASASDYARLQREITAMPAAIGRRPDFFNAISPDHYEGLKREYKTNKDDPNFKDVGTTEDDRDFVHTASCEKLSGDCNKNVEKASYKKGDYVAPEDLDAMWSALQKELEGEAAAGQGMSLSAKGEDFAREKAADAAVALSGEAPRPDAAKSAPSAAAASPATAAVAHAVEAVRGVFRGALTVVLPGRDPKTGERADPLPAIVAAGLTILALGVLFLRRKG